MWGRRYKELTGKSSSRFSLLVLFFFFLRVPLDFVPRRGFGLKEVERWRKRAGRGECLLSL